MGMSVCVSSMCYYYAMDFLTAKEMRVEKNWNKRGLSGLRSNLLDKVDEKDFLNLSDADFAMGVCVLVFSILPAREWRNADKLIVETCGLVGIDMSGVDWHSFIAKVRGIEESLREDIGDE
jgi:hypothetical protein